MLAGFINIFAMVAMYYFLVDQFGWHGQVICKLPFVPPALMHAVIRRGFSADEVANGASVYFVIAMTMMVSRLWLQRIGELGGWRPFVVPGPSVFEQASDSKQPESWDDMVKMFTGPAGSKKGGSASAGKQKVKKIR